MEILLRCTFLLSLIQYGCCLLPVDQHATSETKNLYNNLMKMSRDHTKFIFGMQASTQWGEYNGHSPYKMHDHGDTKSWQFTHAQAVSNYPDELCDVCSLTNQHPGVTGFDLGDFNNKDVVTYLARKAYARGEIITFSWHHSNPVTGHNFYIKNDHGDVLHTIERLLPGGPNHVNLTKNLDHMVQLAHSFKDDKGRPIPFIFRPYHEMSGPWFWWGMNNAAQNTAEQFKQLWQFLVKYLRDVKNVHNILYAYSPGYVTDGQVYRHTYPGDDYVDVLGMDFYYRKSSYITHLISTIEFVVSEAEKRNKIAAVTELGATEPSLDTRPNLWMDMVLTPMRRSGKAMGVAYVSTWVNRCKDDDKCGVVFTPYKGHPAAPDFIRFINDSATVWADTMPDMYS